MSALDFIGIVLFFILSIRIIFRYIYPDYFKNKEINKIKEHQKALEAIRAHIQSHCDATMNQVRRSEILEIKKPEGKFKQVNALSDTFMHHIKKPTPHDISARLLEISDHDCKSSVDDVKRIFTINSALYNVPIPRQMILLDIITMQLYALVNMELELKVYTNNDIVEMEDKTDYSHLHFGLYNDALISIGNVLFTFLTKDDHLPSFHNFVRTIKQNYGSKYSHPMHIIQENELKGVITAFAIKTGIAIPKSYALVNGFTKGLLLYREPNKFKPKLTLIK